MSLNKTKTDPILGQEVHKYLLSKGVETPTRQPSTTAHNPTEKGKIFVDRKSQIEYIERKFVDILGALGLDLGDDSLEETPKRMAKMYVGELFYGLEPESFPKCTTVENKMAYDEMVIERNITVKSMCEHHLLPIVGNANIAYIPKDRVLGLSKMPRIVDYFSRRPQIQERLVEQIYYALQYVLQTDDIAVSINATHMCVSLRGVEDTSADTVTTKLGGSFKDNPSVRAEFLNTIR